MTVMHDPTRSAEDGVQVEYVPPAAAKGNRGRWIVGAVVVVALVGAAGMFGVFGSSVHTAQPQSPAPAKAATPKAAAAAPSTANVPAAGGASKVVAGVPVGYKHTVFGAISASTNYLVAFSQPRMFKPSSLQAAVSQLSDPSDTNDLLASLQPGMNQAAEALRVDPATGQSSMGRLVSRAIPVGYRVVHYDGDSARIAVWLNGLEGAAGGSSTMPVVSSWVTDTVDLRWSHGDWKWSGFVQSQGPTPVGTVNAPSDWQDIADAATSFTPYGYGADQ